MQYQPSYFLQDRGGFLTNSQLQALAMTPVGIIALQNPVAPISVAEIRKAFVSEIKVSSNRFVTVEVGLVPSSQVSGGTPTTAQSTGSPGSQTGMQLLVGNATTPIIISGVIPFETYYVEATGEDNNVIDEQWIVLPGYTLFVRMTQSVTGTGSSGLKWRESL